jgi:D-amino peptidase
MKIFIVVDMEGATGVVHRDQLMAEGRGYTAAQKLLTRDVNAVIEGVLSIEPGATFVVGDGHGTMRNVLLEELHSSAELVVGSAAPDNKPLCQCEGVDMSFDLAVLVGFHSMAGTPGGLLAHTFVGSTICSLRMNGKVVGEAEADAAVLGAFGVPVGLIVGNGELEREIREWNATCGFVSTKRTLGPTAAICKPPAKTQEQISKAAASMMQRAHGGGFPVYDLDGTVEFRVETYRREMTDKACQVDGIVRVGEREFTASGANAAEAFRLMWRGVTRSMDETPAWLQ